MLLAWHTLLISRISKIMTFYFFTPLNTLMGEFVYVKYVDYGQIKQKNGGGEKKKYGWK